MSNEELFAMLGPWAKEKHPEKYQQTLRVAVAPDTFRRYLLRLAEIWVGEDRERLRELPISVLDETGLVAKMKVRGSNEVVEFKGRKAAGPTEYRFLELGLDTEAFAELQRWKRGLDMEYVGE